MAAPGRRGAARGGSRPAAPAPALAAGDDDDTLIDRLATLPRAQWRALEPVAVAMLGKLRGDARTALVALLERRGVVAAGRCGDPPPQAVVRARSATCSAGRRARRDPQLVALLVDRDPDVRAVAVRALGQLADPVVGAGPGTLAAGPALAAPPPRHGRLAGWARTPAGAVRLRRPPGPTVFAPSPRGHGPGRRGRSGADAGPDARRGSLGGRPPARGTGPRPARAARRDRPLLDAAGDHEPTALRVTAAQALGVLGALRAVPVLAGLVGDPPHWLAHTAAAALVASGPRGIAALRDVTGGAEAGAAAHAREALATAGAGRPMTLLDVVSVIVVPANWFVLGYFVVLNTSYLGLILLAVARVPQLPAPAALRRPRRGLRNPLTLGVSVIMPAYNEEATIVESVQRDARAAHPLFEVIVVDDGSTRPHVRDLAGALRPRRGPARRARRRPHAAATSCRCTRRGARFPLVVVRKDNGGKASANNAGINVARQPLVCMVDADSLLDPDALLPSPSRSPTTPSASSATGGVVRAANGSTVTAGRVTEVRMPRSWLPRSRSSSTCGRSSSAGPGWSRAGCARRDLGGVRAVPPGPRRRGRRARHDTIGEDAELVSGCTGTCGRSGGIPDEFLPEPVAWTEVPESVRVLGRQRRRWSRGSPRRCGSTAP